MKIRRQKVARLYTVLNKMGLGKEEKRIFFSLGSKKDNLKLAKRHQARPKQVDEGSLKPTIDALRYLNSNMTP